jgi:hypothetical protein
MPKNVGNSSKNDQDPQYDHAVAILRNRTFRRELYSKEKIQQAVEILRQLDPDHPLLRYSERGQAPETN